MRRAPASHAAARFTAPTRMASARPRRPGPGRSRRPVANRRGASHTDGNAQPTGAVDQHLSGVVERALDGVQTPGGIQAGAALPDHRADAGEATGGAPDPRDDQGSGECLMSGRHGKNADGLLHGPRQGEHLGRARPLLGRRRRPAWPRAAVPAQAMPGSGRPGRSAAPPLPRCRPLRRTASEGDARHALAAGLHVVDFDRVWKPREIALQDRFRGAARQVTR